MGQYRLASIDLDTRAAADAKPRTFRVVISTEAPVERVDEFGRAVREVLSHAPGAVDLSRAPLPLIESHDRRTLPVGVVENVRLDGRKLRGDVRFSENERGAALERDVQAGILRSLSVGYTVERVERSEARPGEPITLTATSWAVHEVSAVAVPADDSAGFNRSHKGKMPPENELSQITHIQPVAAAPSADVLAERERIRTIRDNAEAMGFEAAGESMIERGLTVEQASSEFVTLHAHRRATNPVIPPGGGAPQPGAEVGLDPRAVMIRDMANRRLGLREAARACLSRAPSSGRPAPRSDTELFERAMNTSDFPALLADVAEKKVRAGFESEPATHRAWVDVSTVRDFKESRRPAWGGHSNLAIVEEGAEFTYANLTDDAATIRVRKFGKILSLTFEALVNDDLGAFDRIAAAQGQAARRAESDLVYGLLTSNAGAGPTMPDSVALFHATHANLTSAGSFNSALLAAGRALLRKQKGIGGVGYLGLTPKVLIVSPDEEHDAEILLAQASKILLTGAEGQSPSLSALELVVEPRLDGSACYLAAAPSQAASIEIAYLDGYEAGPHLERREEFSTDAAEFKVRHVFGSAAVDFRGIVKMPIS